jgi:multiple RNA-binding domain-containing protein 1
LAYLRQKSTVSASTAAADARAPKRAKNVTAAAFQAPAEPEPDAEPTGRLLVRNVPYSVDEFDLRELFSQFGTVADVTIPVDDARRQKGIAFVQLTLPEEAVRAAAFSGSTFQGRCLTVLHAAPRETRDAREPKSGGGADKQLSGAYKQVKELERKRKAGEALGWNASHVRSDAVVDSMALKLGVAKGDFLNDADGNMAVRLALGETHLIAENREYFFNEGVDLGALEAANSTAGARARSGSVIVVKNLPTSSSTAELSALFGKFGALSRLLLPPSKTVALIEFVEAAEATRAFKALAYKRFQNVPLYLEWAPLLALRDSGTPTDKANAVVKSSSARSGDDGDGGGGAEDVAAQAGPAAALFVKNLSFATTEAKLRALFEQAGPVRAVSLPKKPASGGPAGSAGFGFVEFASAASVEAALRSLQGHVLDGRALDIKRSEKRLSAPSSAAKGAKGGVGALSAKAARTKLLVKNVAFQANAKELRELFGHFGALKSVRMPKKHDGAHRGFAFVAFAQAHEAREAMARLASTHLYGRHLVIDWVEDEATDEVAVARAAAGKSAALSGKQRKSGSKEKLEDILTAKGNEGSDGEETF